MAMTIDALPKWVLLEHFLPPFCMSVLDKDI